MTAYQRATLIVQVLFPCPKPVGKKCKAPRFCRVCVDAIRMVSYEIREAEGDAMTLAAEKARALGAARVGQEIEHLAHLVYPAKKRRKSA